ncbi:MAG: PAS domain-containing protein [Candidatus Omnitrophica bacterium]|nr:PAS domain-containing protein [Candidatus Omnitrophota bacterium]
MDYLVIGVYAITGIISIAIALLLVHLAKLSAQAKMKAERLALGSDGATLSDENLKKAIFQEIRELEYSKGKSEEIAEKVSSIFVRELEKKVTANSYELSSRYETIIKEKSQNEEIAWKKYKKILANKKETEAVIRSIAEGLVVVDAKGKVVMMNPAAEKLLGVQRKDKIGKPILENLKREQLVSLVKENPEKGGDKEIELVSKEDDTKRILRSSSAVIEDEGGQTVGMVSVLTDITKQKEIDQLKSNFVSNITHELRTPLVAVQKSITLLLSRNAGQISDTQEHFLSAADRNLKRLSILIDDLLDLSKIEAGKLKLKYELASVGKIIDDTIENLFTWAKTKSISVVKKVSEALPEVNMDADRILQVMNNLVGNAIKFTPENGTITIEAKLLEDKEELEVSVADTGIGITQEDMEKIFDRFYQAGERTLTDISGTGIGLSISKEIVELHGGRIRVESNESVGAKFIFTIPINR